MRITPLFFGILTLSSVATMVLFMYINHQYISPTHNGQDHTDQGQDKTSGPDEYKNNEVVSTPTKAALKCPNNETVYVPKKADLIAVGKLLLEARGARDSQKKNRLLDQALGEVERSLGSTLATESIKRGSKSDTQQAAAPKGRVDVCREVYTGNTKGDNPLGGRDGDVNELGWEMETCSNAESLDNMLTILVNARNYSKLDTENLLRQIREFYPMVKIDVASTHDVSNFKNVKSFNEKHMSWYNLVDNVKTKYSLVLKDVLKFTKYARIERMMSASYYLEAPIVGAASVGFNGHWWNNCYQTKMVNYKLAYTHGYYFSKNSCMYCDHITGPFLARTDVLKSSMRGSDDFVFEKLFLDLKSKGVASLVCPDSMFHVDRIFIEKYNTKQRWLPFARQQMLEEIALYPQMFRFDCKELQIVCNPRKLKGIAIPPCCFKEIAQCFNRVNQLAMENDVPLTLYAGSLLGALKLRGILPWELDSDMLYDKVHNAKVDKFMTDPDLLSMRCYVQPINHYLGVMGRKMLAGGWRTDIKPRPAELLHMGYLKGGFNRTHIRFEGMWLPAPPSPGLVARNRYRTEIYHHVPHPAQGGKYVSSRGFFPRCPKPGHHACLDELYTDGSFQFDRDF